MTSSSWHAALRPLGQDDLQQAVLVTGVAELKKAEGHDLGVGE